MTFLCLALTILKLHIFMTCFCCSDIQKTQQLKAEANPKKREFWLLHPPELVCVNDICNHSSVGIHTCLCGCTVGHCEAAYSCVSARTRPHTHHGRAVAQALLVAQTLPPRESIFSYFWHLDVHNFSSHSLGSWDDYFHPLLHTCPGK